MPSEGVWSIATVLCWWFLPSSYFQSGANCTRILVTAPQLWTPSSFQLPHWLAYQPPRSWTLRGSFTTTVQLFHFNFSLFINLLLMYVRAVWRWTKVAHLVVAWCSNNWALLKFESLDDINFTNNWKLLSMSSTRPSLNYRWILRGSPVLLPVSTFLCTLPKTSLPASVSWMVTVLGAIRCVWYYFTVDRILLSVNSSM